MNPLLNEFKKYGNLSPEIESELNRRIKTFHKKKGDYFLKQGQVISNLFVIEKGLVRVFFVKNGKEINSWFATENEIVSSILPLYFNKPSFENIQFLEDSFIYSVSANDLNKIYETYPEFNEIGRKIAEKLCGILEERMVSLHTETAEERYKSLIGKNPDLLQRVALGHIASYLGITQETLSRIRNRF
ncbi:MAG: Crp/Fnr family transcriptional regulator [Cruoricaptor ignavus]|nr:Crp/Fnr family transcriptional regulator [Cruoricaptor ignavus]